MTELVFRDDAYTRSCAARVTAVDERGIRLDRTVFYPAGGGQPGDSGVLRLADDSTIAIVDAVKGDGADEVIHVPATGPRYQHWMRRSAPRSTGSGGIG
jgi:misacylated tRNA(Ala) deacylase